MQPRSQESHVVGGCRDQQAGFLLVELLFGIVVLAVAISTSVSLSLQHSRLRRMSEETNLAAIVCRNNLEDLRSVAFATLPTLDGVGFDVPGVNGSPGGLRAIPGDTDGLPGEFHVVVDQTSGGEILYRVVAEVIWVGATGRRAISFTSLFADRQN